MDAKVSQKIIESMLEQRIGLAVEAVGQDAITKAIGERMAACGLSDMANYCSEVTMSEAEWHLLIEAVIVPETWFFRNGNSFHYLRRYVMEQWLPENRNRNLRVLSLASATGEEPFSIAMTLLGAGLCEDRFHIDALDISREALKKAAAGVYRDESFRGHDLSFRTRYFDEKKKGYQILPSVRDCVRFIEGNLIDTPLLAQERPYDILFCRNVLIYMSAAARKTVFNAIDVLLVPEGILFVGHAERGLATETGYQRIQASGVFAFRRTTLQPKKEVNAAAGLRSKMSVPPKTEVDPPKSVPISKFSTYRHSGTVSAEVDLNPPVRFKAPEAKDLLDKAQTHADRGELGEAFQLCERILTDDGACVPAIFLKGLLSQALGDEFLAEEYFTKTLYLDPKHKEALHLLTLLVESSGDRVKEKNLRQWAQRLHQEDTF